MLTRLHVRVQRAKGIMHEGWWLMGLMLGGFAITMLGYPDAITAHEFKTFGIDSWWFMGVGGGIVVLVAIPYFTVSILDAILANRAYFCSRGEAWPHPWLNLCDDQEACSCS